MRLAPTVLSVLTVIACTGLATPSALAADLSQHPTLDEDSFLPEEIGTGWYLRGDVGYSFNDVGSMSHRGVSFGGLDAKDGFTGTIGFGYQFTDMVRADLTIDRLNRADLSGTGSCAAWSVCPGGGATSERMTLGATAVMANVYADLGTWHGLTPYVGAGIGAAYVDATKHVSANASSSRVLGGYEDWALAANVSAGASYTISEGLMVDLGYRFLWIGSGESGGSATEAGHVEAKDLTAHQIRAGLRYYLF